MKLILSLFLVIILNSAPIITKNIEIKAVGDIMPGSLTPKNILPSDSGKIFINGIEKYLIDDGITIGNFECAVAADSVKPEKCTEESRNAGRCYEFGTKPYLVKRLKELGFDALSLDNNHSLDYGEKGLHAAETIINSLGMVSALPSSKAYLNLGTRRIAIIPFGFSELSAKLWDIEKVKKSVKDESDKGNLVIVFFHGGAEGSKAAHVRDTMEYFLDEKRGNVISFAHAAIESGADLVIGSGPHVLRSLELYKGKLIAYSLGNFLTYGNFNIRGINGISAILKIQLDEETGDFKGGRLIPIHQLNPGYPEFDTRGASIKLMKELTKTYTQSFINIDDNGVITAN